MNKKDSKKFKAEKLIASETYRNVRDVLSAVLTAGKTYSKSEADELIKNYLEKELN